MYLKVKTEDKIFSVDLQLFLVLLLLLKNLGLFINFYQKSSVYSKLNADIKFLKM